MILPTTVLQVTLLELQGTTKHTEHTECWCLHDPSDTHDTQSLETTGAVNPRRNWAMLGHMVSVKILKGQVLEPRQTWACQNARLFST